MKKFYHRSESPDYNINFFKDEKDKIKKIPKTLIVTGGSRNGNHLVWSLLDGHSKIPFIPGEDRFLSQLSIRNLNDSKKFMEDLRKDKFLFLKKLSGMTFDKWKVLDSKKINLNKWAGKHEKEYVPILEFPNLIHEINYNKFKKKLENDYKKIKRLNFYQIFKLYLNAFKLLSPIKKKTVFKYVYAQSGLRREIMYLLQNKSNFKFLVPIRKFETFYFSKIKGLYNTTYINKKLINEAWDHWFHKTNDYILLKQKFPKNIILIQFEDLEDVNKREITMKKILKKIGLKFEKINNYPTIFKKPVLPNSSFFIKRKNNITKDGIKSNLKFPTKKIPKEYFKTIKIVKKLSY